MDPATIAASVISILAPFAKDAGKKLVETVGDIAANKAKSLMEWLKQKLQGDPGASKDLSRFEKDPDQFKSGLKATLEERAQQDPTFAAELKERIADFGPVIAVLQQIEKGEDIIGAKIGEVASGKVGVTQKIAEAKKVTGVEVQKVG